MSFNIVRAYVEPVCVFDYHKIHIVRMSDAGTTRYFTTIILSGQN